MLHRYSSKDATVGKPICHATNSRSQCTRDASHAPRHARFTTNDRRRSWQQAAGESNSGRKCPITSFASQCTKWECGNFGNCVSQGYLPIYIHFRWVLHNGRIVLRQSIALLRYVAANLEADNDTYHLIVSCSRLFTSTAVGIADLADRNTRYFGTVLGQHHSAMGRQYVDMTQITHWPNSFCGPNQCHSWSGEILRSVIVKPLRCVNGVWNKMSPRIFGLLATLPLPCTRHLTITHFLYCYAN